MSSKKVERIHEDTKKSITGLDEFVLNKLNELIDKVNKMGEYLDTKMREEKNDNSG